MRSFRLVAVVAAVVATSAGAATDPAPGTTIDAKNVFAGPAFKSVSRNVPIAVPSVRHNSAPAIPSSVATK